MLTPALLELAEDRDCFGAPASVYLWLLTHLLDVLHFKPVKAAGVAAAMGVSPSAVRRSLDVLERRGYLQREAREDALVAYRIRFARASDGPGDGAARAGKGTSRPATDQAPHAARAAVPGRLPPAAPPGRRALGMRGAIPNPNGRSQK